MMNSKQPSKTDLLSSLSREDKLRLIEMIEEKERRERENRDVYRPNEGQLPIHKSDARIRVVFSGNGAGKTAMSVNEAFWALKGFNPVTNKLTPAPARVIVVLDKPEKIEQTWLPEIKKWFNVEEKHLRKNGKPYYSEIILDNGSSLAFMFHLQEPMAFESIEADFFVFDEPCPRNIFLSLMRGGRKKGRKARFLLVGTPIAASWLRKDIYEPWSRGDLPDTECFRFGTVVNQNNLSEGYIEDFSRHLSDKEKMIRLHGQFFDLDGLALAHLFKRDTHVISNYVHDESSPCVVAIDPHPNKNHVACLLACDRDGYLYYVKELSSKSAPRQFAKELKEFYKGYRVIDIICDSSGNTPRTGGDGNLSFMEVLKKEGIHVRGTSWEDKKDEEWLMRIQDVLTLPEKPNNYGQTIPKLRVVSDCRGVIADIENVTWQKFRNEDAYKPKLDISNRDFLATLKYALTTNLNYSRKNAKPFRRTKPVKAYGQR